MPSLTPSRRGAHHGGAPRHYYPHLHSYPPHPHFRGHADMYQRPLGSFDYSDMPPPMPTAARAAHYAMVQGSWPPTLNRKEAPWSPPHDKEEDVVKDDAEEQARTADAREHASAKEQVKVAEGAADSNDDENEDGDPLALLAQVSSSFEEGEPQQKSPARKKNLLRRTLVLPTRATRPQSIAPAPTSPIQRRDKETPSSASTTAADKSAPKPITPVANYYQPAQRGGHYYPPHHHHRYPPPYHPHMYPEEPNLVERQSFSFDSVDSQGSRGYYAHAPPPYGYYPPPPEGYWPPPPPHDYHYSHYPGYPPRSAYPPEDTARSSSSYPATTPKILRKKFSWRHYPELEKFLIDHRDEYLQHSAKNYTAEQKQYNNWLTKQVIAAAESFGYAFSDEDFNFVGIRDRIRCYYKSYVQTARKRGLPLPSDQGSTSKKQRTDALS